MGTDNLFHKRKERKAELLRRRQAMKAPYDVILITAKSGQRKSKRESGEILLPFSFGKRVYCPWS